MSANSLKLQCDATARAEVRPDFILPFTTLIHLDALRGTDGPQPSCAEDIPDFLGIFGAHWVKKGVLRKNIYRMHHDEIVEDQKVYLNLLLKAGTVVVPAIGT